MKYKPNIDLRIFNNYVTLLALGIGLYILLAPFLPAMRWWLAHDAPVTINLGPTYNGPPATPSTSPDVPAENRLYIPGLSMQQKIHEGGIAALKKGVLHVAHTSTPDKGSNTVLVGHRFTYAGQAVFYHLDKVKPGDPISLMWQGKLYNYTVNETKVVPATEVSVEAATDQPQLTIYTCTPLWSAKERLVIIAKLTEEQP
ncbi:MAG TPA: sortase [Candidatus Saccharimonadales bacterium]|nr:sortase [Candidatus Saccharimonadales bacterium]